MDKKKVIRNAIIISIVVIIVGVLVFSYAMFFNTSVSDNSTKLGNLYVEYIDGEEVTIDNLLPINSDEVEEKANVFNFSVENNGNSYAYYDIKLVDMDLPLALKDLTLKWRLTNNGQVINEGNFLEIENTKYYLKRSIGINGKDINKYKLQIWIENSNSVDQNYMLNRSGSFKIQIEARQKLAKSSKDEITVISNTTNGNLENLKIYGNAIDGKNVGDNKVINITVSQNLVDNGLGELGNNTNFSNATSHATYSDEKYKSLGSFYRSVNSSFFVTSSKIAINTSKEYYMNMCAKSNNTDAMVYLGIRDHYIDGSNIYFKNYSSVKNSLTYLTKDLKNGDEYVYLNDVSGFTGNNINANSGLIFWNYVDSRGVAYPNETYSKNVWLYLYEFENIDKENNRIKLNEKWNHGTFNEGTFVSQSNDSNTYNYVFSDYSKLSENFKCYEATVVGERYDRDKTNFRPYTKYTNIAIIENKNNIPNTIIYYSRFIIRKNENIQNITIDMNGHEPLRSIDDMRDYIDYKNKRIVRLINSDGTIKSNPEYEPITLPEIKTYDGNTIIESNDESSPLFQAEY